MRGMDQPTRLADLLPNWIAQITERNLPADTDPTTWLMQNYREWLVNGVCEDLSIAWGDVATASCDLDRIGDPRLKNVKALLNDAIDALVRVHDTLDIMPIFGTDPGREAEG